MGILAWFFGDKCSYCRSNIKSGAQYCAECGKPNPGAKVFCSECGASMQATANYCPQCKNNMRRTDTPVDSLNRWQRSPDDFARRIEATDLRGSLECGLIVEPGTQALIFQGGKLAAITGEGTYNLVRPMKGIDVAIPTTAIVMDAGDTCIPILYQDLHTQDDVPIDIIIDVIVRLGDAAAFYTNLMHGVGVLSLAALANIVWSVAAGTVRAHVARTSAKNLSNLDITNVLEADLRGQIAPSLARCGLELVAIRFMNSSSPVYDKIRQRRAETSLFEEKVADTKNRGILNQRLREVLTTDRMNEFSSAQELEQFVLQTEHEMGMKNVIREAELDELKRSYANKSEDAEIARNHILDKLELEHRLALLSLHHGLSDAELQNTIVRERKELQAKHETDWAEFEHRRKISIAAGDLKREERLKDTHTDIEAARMHIALGKDAIELRAKKDQAEHERESQRIDRDERVKDADARRQQDDKEQDARHEQARLAIELQKTEMFKGMSEGQILALMAQGSPEVAKAIAQAHAQAASNSEIKALYEKVFASKEAESDRIERFAGRMVDSAEHMACGAASHAHRQEEEIRSVMRDGMDRMADVAAARARSGGGSSNTTDVICPNCHRHVSAGSKFCDNCGHQFFS